MVPEDYGGMLDIHLRRIERHTRPPYAIYGTAVRSAPAAVERLRSHPRVRLVPVPATELRGSAEHSYYLDRLVAVAIDEGATHVVVLHVDSFPIHDEWVGALLRHLTATCVLVTGEGIDPSCLAFTREFFQACRPVFLPSLETQATAGYARCVSEWRLVEHTGVGYAVAACREGYTMHFLPPERRDDSPSNLYASSVFHLGGGLQSRAPAAPASQALRSVRATLFRAGAWAIRAVSTPRFRALMRRRLAGEPLRRFDMAREERLRIRVRQEMAELLADPDRYLVGRWGAAAGK
jgi:hypothetical protein